MRWYLKSAGFKVLSALPGGGQLYAFSQEHVTKSTAASRRRVEQKIGVGLQYWQWLKTHGYAETLRQGTLLDFGAGWHPTIPLLFHSLGAPKQLLLDVMPLINVQRARDTLRIFCDVASDPANSWQRELVRLPNAAGSHGQSVNELLLPFGLSYYAPYPGIFMPVPAGVDLIFCTQVLQHLNREAQLEVFRWLYRILKPGGLLLTTIHLVGQFSNPNLETRRYEHLKFSPWVWEKILNSSMMNFNRLKGPDYRETIQQAGFHIRDFVVEPPTPTDLEQFAHTAVHPCFQRYAREELAAKHLFIVAEKT